MGSWESIVKLMKIIKKYDDYVIIENIMIIHDSAHTEKKKKKNTNTPNN